MEEEFSRIEPATEKPPPPAVVELAWRGWKAASDPGGSENPRPSWNVMIKTPGFRGGAGGVALASEAADWCQPDSCEQGSSVSVPMPLASVTLMRGVVGAGLEGFSLTMVDVEDDRLKAFEMGARCVSLSSSPG